MARSTQYWWRRWGFRLAGGALLAVALCLLLVLNFAVSASRKFWWDLAFGLVVLGGGLVLLENFFLAGSRRR